MIGAPVGRSHLGSRLHVAVWLTIVEDRHSTTAMRPATGCADVTVHLLDGRVDAVSLNTRQRLTSMLPTARYSPRTAHRRANLALRLLLALLVVCALVIALMLYGSPVRQNNEGHRQRLFMHTAAGLRGPAEKIAAQYEQECGIAIDLQFGGSNTLLNQLQINKFDTSDLLLVADDFYTRQAVSLGLAAETLPIATQRPVIAVRTDSTLAIATLEDLLNESVRVSLPDPDQTACGKAVKEALEAITIEGTTLWSKLRDHVTAHGVFKPTVNDVATDVTLGAVDAGIVWDSTVAMPGNRDNLRAINVPIFDTKLEIVSLALLKSSKQRTEALRFARYLAAKDRGLPIFEEFGMQAVEGRPWSEDEVMSID